MAAIGEAADGPAKGDRHPEGRYKYLDDFCKREPTPSLRVCYQDSFSKPDPYVRSPGRSCPRGSSRRKSQERQEQPYSPAGPHYSPSCSTFNPRRETTQEQFSPYDERREEQEDRLAKQLLQENAHLVQENAHLLQENAHLRQDAAHLAQESAHLAQENAQLRAEVGRLRTQVGQLQAEAARWEAEAVELRQAGLAEQRYFQKVVGEMTGEIQIVLTKNKMLENELIAANADLHHYLHFQDAQQCSRDFDRARSTQPRRSVGKVVARPPHPESMATSKIRIEEDHVAGETCKVGEGRGAAEKEARRSEELISSIKSMQFKISGEQAGSLRELWKWLKGVGHAHSCLKKWKAKAEGAHPDRLKELVREACSYIE